jgi:hypothetical protein
MITPASRDLSTPEQRQSLKNIYQSIFFAELLAPSRPLWLFSSWISDIAIVDNRARQFQSLCPNWEAREIRLSECLDAICDRGGTIALVLRNEEHNAAFIDVIKKTNGWYDRRIGLAMSNQQHAKSMIGEHFIIDGSMNYTYNGITFNDEKVVYRCAESAIHEELIKLAEQWGSRIQWGPRE